jgi:uncharacterized protein YdiU (UPF0061 family)
MWTRKLGLTTFDPTLLRDLLHLMVRTKVDYTILFRQLSNIPDCLSALKKSFYESGSAQLDAEWTDWLRRWRDRVKRSGDVGETSASMKRVNPSVTWREWLIAPAYQEAELGHHGLVHEIQEAFSTPYSELSSKLAAKYDRLKPNEFFNAGGVSHYSCSS